MSMANSIFFSFFPVKTLKLRVELCKSCNSKLPPGNPLVPKCERIEEFKSDQWCGLVKDTKSPWKDCIAVCIV